MTPTMWLNISTQAVIIIFGAGIVWSAVRYLRKDLEDLSKSISELAKEVHRMNTRVSRLEGRVSRMGDPQ